MPWMEQQSKIRTFIVDNFLFGIESGLNDYTPFLDAGDKLVLDLPGGENSAFAFAKMAALR